MKITAKDQLDRVDRILLKGVYTNDRRELENPRFLKDVETLEELTSRANVTVPSEVTPDESSRRII